MLPPPLQVLSVIIPSYNEQDNIERTFQAIKNILKPSDIPFEVIYIDDGSDDLTYSNITSLSENNPEVKGLSFSKNFGKEAAIFAGLEAASGSCCVVMDCDLQHPVSLLPEMYRLWQAGYEVVKGVKASRGKENLLHTLCANSFYHIISKAAGVDLSKASDFQLLDRKAMDALLLMPERAPFFRALSSWIGFKSVTIPFEVQERTVGIIGYYVSKIYNEIKARPRYVIRQRRGY